MLLLGSDWLLYDSSLSVTCIPAPARMNDTDLSLHNEWTYCVQIHVTQDQNCEKISPLKKSATSLRTDQRLTDSIGSMAIILEALILHNK